MAPPNLDWPRGFAEVFEYARPGGARPREFDHVAVIGGDSPHSNYPLRNVAEENFSLRQGNVDFTQQIGRVTLQQAIREAFPGAVYLHLMQSFRVNEWRSSSFERAIRVSPARSRQIPRPLIRTFVNATLARDGLVEGHLRQGATGLLAECHLQITERVEGYRLGNERYLYRELRQQNPAMTAKTRDFRTTGVLLKVEEDWFKGNTKQVVADALRNLLLREYSISPQDADAAATNIALLDGGMPRHTSDAIVVYDAVYGSLRLTEPIFLGLDRLLERLDRAVQLAEGDGLLDLETVTRLQAWCASLSDAEPSMPGQVQVHDGEILVLAPGSLVAVRDAQGVLRDVEIIEPELVDVGEGPKLFYRYRIRSTNGRALVAHDKVELIGNEWTHVTWNPATGEYRETDGENV